MSGRELADFRAHPDAYFGTIMPLSKKITNNFEVFEWLMEAHKDMPREKLLAHYARDPRMQEIEVLSDGDLLMAYCESMTAAFAAATRTKMG